MRNNLWKMLGLVILSLALSGYQNVPPLPYSIYGRAMVNGADASAGSLITAWIGGIKYAETRSFDYEGQTVFSLDVPGDDPDTAAKEGGLPGEEVVFKIANLPASPAGIWQSGTNSNVDLSAEGSFIYLPVLMHTGQ